MYKLPPFGNMVIRLSDGAFVPKTNEDYVAWLTLGNTPAPADPPPPPTQEQVDLAAAKADALIQQVAGMTPAQILAFIQQTFPGLSAAQQKFLFVCGVAASFAARHY